MRQGLLLLAGVVLVSACAGNAEPSTADAPSGEVVVFAAASLTESFEQMAEEIEADRPDLRATFSFGGSSSLAPQVLSGAPVDVFASASPATMEQVVDGDAVAGEPVLFARNRLQIAVPPDNPADVESLSDLAGPELKLALCAPEVPCGDAAVRALGSGDVDVDPVTLEEDVKAVLTKVALGEVDAGLVYRTDVLAAGGNVEGIDFPAAGDAINDYLLAQIRDAPNPGGAKVFVDFVESERGREILGDAGFELP